MKRLENLLFDLDGTLSDPMEGITKCLVHALTELELHPPDPVSLEWCIGPPLRESLETLLGNEKVHLVPRALDLYRERFATLGLYENQLYGGIVSALRKLKQNGYRTWLCTSKPTVYALDILKYFQISHYFTGVYGSRLDGALSEKEALIAHLIAAEGLDRELTAMIGDREHDMAGARANGIAAFGVTWGYGTLEALDQAGAQHIFHDIDALVEFLAP